MKPYQHHDETQDQGKAEPKPKAPSHASPKHAYNISPVSQKEYAFNYCYTKRPDVKGNKQTRVVITRSQPRAVTVKRQSRGPAAQAKAHRL